MTSSFGPLETIDCSVIPSGTIACSVVPSETIACSVVPSGTIVCSVAPSLLVATVNSKTIYYHTKVKDDECKNAIILHLSKTWTIPQFVKTSHLSTLEAY